MKFTCNNFVTETYSNNLCHCRHQKKHCTIKMKKKRFSKERISIVLGDYPVVTSSFLLWHLDSWSR